MTEQIARAQDVRPTPGPWVIVYHAPNPETPGRVHIGSPSIGHTVIDTEYPGRWTMSEADANLIADAPALLDALHDVMVNGSSDPSGKACGHEFMCLCPQDAALALLRKHGRPV